MKVSNCLSLKRSMILFSSNISLYLEYSFKSSISVKLSSSGLILCNVTTITFINKSQKLSFNGFSASSWSDLKILFDKSQKQLEARTHMGISSLSDPVISDFRLMISAKFFNILKICFAFSVDIPN
uniref:Ynl0454p n=1 Tax=Saccharomyces cerevisiae TaxID=4932 RepID=V9H051_YEASX|nr:Ynl0454p [Saccharomyces cerevisiae]